MQFNVDKRQTCPTFNDITHYCIEIEEMSDQVENSSTCETCI